MYSWQGKYHNATLISSDGSENGGKQMNPEELKEIREGYWGRAGSAQESMVGKLFAHIDVQAKQISALKEEVDCADIIEALEEACVPMGDSEQSQDIITAIGILGNRISALKAALVKERKEKMQLDASRFNMGIPEGIAIDRAKEQLARELPDIDWEGKQ